MFCRILICLGFREFIIIIKEKTQKYQIHVSKKEHSLNLYSHYTEITSYDRMKRIRLSLAFKCPWPSVTKG